MTTSQPEIFANTSKNIVVLVVRCFGARDEYQVFEAPITAWRIAHDEENGDVTLPVFAEDVAVALRYSGAHATAIYDTDQRIGWTADGAMCRDELVRALKAEALHARRRRA
ncbi:MAG: hypothetical protein JSR73_12135 [Proteobacteria bacterium]|nr:hypothetical protein [Pseudomonadota bacterium]